MKKIIATLLLLTLALTLTACAAISPAAPRKTFARGTWDGNTYTSEFAELTLTLPESGWTISTDEEIADQMGISRDLLDSTELEEAIMEQTNITDMMAVDSTTGANIILMFVNLSGYADKDAVSLDDVADQIVDGLRATDVFDYEVGETSRTTLCGNEYLLLTAAIPAYDMHQAYLMRREGDMVIELILTATHGNTTDDLLALFHD